MLAVEALHPHKPTDPIFRVKRIKASFELACGRLNFPHVTPHHLRHYRISEWASKTRDQASVQVMARHKSIATTAKYVRSRTEQAARMLAEIAANSKTAPLHNSKTVALYP